MATFTPHIGKKCIIRTYASGVHFGTLTAQDGRQVELQNARRLWRWDVARPAHRPAAQGRELRGCD